MKKVFILCREKQGKFCEIVNVFLFIKEFIYWYILCRLRSLICKINDKWFIVILFVIKVSFIKKMKYVYREEKEIERQRDREIKYSLVLKYFFNLYKVMGFYEVEKLQKNFN